METYVGKAACVLHDHIVPNPYTKQNERTDQSTTCQVEAVDQLPSRYRGSLLAAGEADGTAGIVHLGSHRRTHHRNEAEHASLGQHAEDHPIQKVVGVDHQSQDQVEGHQIRRVVEDGVHEVDHLRQGSRHLDCKRVHAVQ